MPSTNTIEALSAFVADDNAVGGVKQVEDSMEQIHMSAGDLGPDTAQELPPDTKNKDRDNDALDVALGAAIPQQEQDSPDISAAEKEFAEVSDSMSAAASDSTPDMVEDQNAISSILPNTETNSDIIELHTPTAELPRHTATADEDTDKKDGEKSEASGRVEGVMDMFSSFLESLGGSPGATFSDFLDQDFSMETILEGNNTPTIGEELGNLLADGSSPISQMEGVLGEFISGLDYSTLEGFDTLMTAVSMGIDLTSIGANDMDNYVDPSQSVEIITQGADTAAADTVFSVVDNYMSSAWMSDMEHAIPDWADNGMDIADFLQTDDFTQDILDNGWNDLDFNLSMGTENMVLGNENADALEAIDNEIRDIQRAAENDNIEVARTDDDPQYKTDSGNDNRADNDNMGGQTDNGQTNNQQYVDNEPWDDPVDAGAFAL